MSRTYRSTTINFMDVMVYEVSRHFWKLAISAGSVLVFCYASLMPVSLYRCHRLSAVSYAAPN
jgi:hypothetical protein